MGKFLSSINNFIIFPSANLSLHHDWRYTFTPNRPKCNSILHLFGEWLFEAAFIGTDQEQQFTSKYKN